jgi:hypothetical protein
VALESEYSHHIRNHAARRNRWDLTARGCSHSSFFSSHRYEHRTLSPSPHCHYHRRRCRLHPGCRRLPPQPPVLTVLLAPSFSLTISSRRPHLHSCSCPLDLARPTVVLSTPPLSFSPSPMLLARPSCKHSGRQPSPRSTPMLPPALSARPCSHPSFPATRATSLQPTA